MNKYEKLGFTTSEEIMELVRKLSPDFEEYVKNSIEKESPIVAFSYVEQNSVQQKNSFTPELGFERKGKVFTKVDNGIYTESKEFFHITQARLQNLTMKGYLENFMNQVEKAEKVAKKQAEEYGEIKDERINNG